MRSSSSLCLLLFSSSLFLALASPKTEKSSTVAVDNKGDVVRDDKRAREVASPEKMMADYRQQKIDEVKDVFNRLRRQVVDAVTQKPNFWTDLMGLLQQDSLWGFVVQLYHTIRDLVLGLLGMPGY